MHFGQQTNVSVSYLFIDAASLRQALDEIGAIYFSGDILTPSWLNLKATSRKAFYYDAIPVRKAEEDQNTYTTRIEPKRKELEEIERQTGYHVRTGDVHRRKTRGNEQKMVDVQLAVDALSMASRGLFNSCSLITGDLDFRPLVSALVEMGIDVTLWYPPKHTSTELMAAADQSFPIKIHLFHSYLNLTTDQSRYMPTSYIDYIENAAPQGTIQKIWQDPAYGECQIVEQESVLRLVTTHFPGRLYHRLVAAAPNEAILRLYVSESYDLTVPEGSESQT